MIQHRRQKRDLVLVDTTLRDGEQAAGVVFFRQEKQKIAQLLSLTGIDELEAGIPVMGLEEQETIRSLVRMQLPVRLICWCRANQRDLAMAKDCRTDAVHLSFAGSGVLQKTFGMTGDSVVGALDELVKSARTDFSFVSVGAQDVARAGRSFLLEFCRKAFALGVDRVRLADTLGAMNPFQVFSLIQFLRDQGVEGDLEFHAHNDLGMATANALAAVEAGATSLSVTVNGLGERAGNAALEEVALALKMTVGKSCGIDLRMLSALSQRVADCSGRAVPEAKPVVGTAAFSHESGIHTRGLIKNPESYELISARQVGRKGSEFVIGKHSGGAAIGRALLNEGIFATREEQSVIVGEMRKIFEDRKKPLSSQELRTLYHRMHRI